MQTVPSLSGCLPAVNISADLPSVLEHDQANIKKLFKRFELVARKKNMKWKVQLASKICTELVAHLLAEEELIYSDISPMRASSGTALAEHDRIKDLIGQIVCMEPADASYDASVNMLAECLHQHIQNEQACMPGLIPQDIHDAKALAAVFSMRKKQLASQLYNGNGEIDRKQLKVMIGESMACE